MKNPLFMNAIKTRLTATVALSTVLISTLTAATAVAPSGIAPIAAAQNSQDCVATMLSSESALHEPTVIEKALRFRQAWQLTTGAGITVAVIDTGVSPNERLGEVLDGGDFVDGNSGFVDCDGHGTLVAGIIAGRPGADGFAGLAPDAHVLSIRQTADGEGNLESLAQAIDKAVAEGARVINISLTSCAPAGVMPQGATDVAESVARAEVSGAVVVAAAGNKGDSCQDGSVAWPAVLPEVIAVSAVQFDDAGQAQPAEYAITGQWVNVSAPGGPVLGPDPRTPSGLIDRHVFGSGDNTRAQQIAGTSFATPAVSGTAALLLARNPELSPAQVRDIILNSASPISSGLGLGRGIIAPYDALIWTTVDTAAQHAANPAAAPAPPDLLTSQERNAPLRATGLLLICALGLGAWLLSRPGQRP